MASACLRGDVTEFGKRQQLRRGVARAFLSEKGLALAEQGARADGHPLSCFAG